MRTRFAPSPTGYLHIGGLRTALYAYLLAKKEGGKFFLRIEDTDQVREVEGAVEGLIKVLHLLSIDHDEGPTLDGKEKGNKGPYTQSKRTDLYKKYADKLLEDGHAYRCFCSKERLDQLRDRQRTNKQAPMYDRKCLDLAKSEIQEKLDAGESFVIRHRVPYEQIKFKDLVFGNMQFHGKTIDDTILMKSDGYPTYHLAHVVDDHLMETTHVLRGEEWLPSTPKHIFLFQALGWEAPQYAHLSLILNPDRTKLSKRQGHVAVEDFLKDGYSKEALINFVAFLGWNPGGGEKEEIYSLEELIKIFSLEKVHKAGAVFDREKLNWFNWQWARKTWNKELSQLAKELDQNVEIIEDRRKQFSFNFSSEDIFDKFINERGERLISLSKQHIKDSYLEQRDKLKKALITVEDKIQKNAKETQDSIAFYFELPDYDKSLLTHEKMKVDFDIALTALNGALEALDTINNWTEKSIQDILLNTVEKLNLKNGQVLWPLRAALSGLEFSPGVFEAAWALGKKESLERIKMAISKF